MIVIFVWSKVAVPPVIAKLQLLVVIVPPGSNFILSVLESVTVTCLVKFAGTCTVTLVPLVKSMTSALLLLTTVLIAKEAGVPGGLLVLAA